MALQYNSFILSVGNGTIPHDDTYIVFKDAKKDTYWAVYKSELVWCWIAAHENSWENASEDVRVYGIHHAMGGAPVSTMQLLDAPVRYYT